MKKRLYTYMIMGFFIGFILAWNGFSLQNHTERMSEQKRIERFASEEIPSAVPTWNPKMFASAPSVYSQVYDRKERMRNKAEYPQAPIYLVANYPTAPPTLQGAAPKKKTLTKRQQVLMVAKSYVHKIDYLWGGKCKDSDISGKTTPKSLDCSGFIQFVYSKVEGERIGQLGSTISIANLQTIPSKELKPGDIGLKRGTGSLYYDAKGRAYPAPALAERANTHLLKKTIHKINCTKKEIKKLQKMRQDRQEILLEQNAENPQEELSEQTIDGAETDALEAILDQAETVEQNRQIKKIDKRVMELSKKLKKLCQRRRIFEEDITRRIDHVGIYCGKDKKGNAIWCHCSSSQHGVVWEKTDIFKRYFRYYSK